MCLKKVLLCFGGQMETAMLFFIVCKTKATGPQVSRVEERKIKVHHIYPFDIHDHCPSLWDGITGREN